MITFVSKSIRVPLEAIKGGAERITTLSESIQDYFDQLGNVANGMPADGSWRGSDIEAFINANESNKKKYEKLIQNLSEMGKVLKMYTTVMENTDKEWAAKIKAIG